MNGWNKPIQQEETMEQEKKEREEIGMENKPIEGREDERVEMKPKPSDQKEEERAE
jgi:hypothetical protein